MNEAQIREIARTSQRWLALQNDLTNEDLRTYYGEETVRRWIRECYGQLVAAIAETTHDELQAQERPTPPYPSNPRAIKITTFDDGWAMLSTVRSSFESATGFAFETTLFVGHDITSEHVLLQTGSEDVTAALAVHEHAVHAAIGNGMRPDITPQLDNWYGTREEVDRG